MRIASLNVNGFCGLADKRGYFLAGEETALKKVLWKMPGKYVRRF